MRVYHFMRYKWWFLGSLAVVTLFAVLAIFVMKLDLGIDFKGGTRMQFSLQQEASVDQVRGVVTDAGVFEPVVQSVGTPGTGNGFMVTAQEMDQAQIDAVKAALTSKYGLDPLSTAVEQVGASFGKSTTSLAFMGVGIAIVFIIGYLWFRFELKFAIPAIFALIHDVGLTLGVYAVSQRLVTSATVAAILTILGYSVHDTIIVYDRMRENTLLMKKETYGDMVDLSIRQTMVRSINTTIALLLPLLAILIFGGPTLKDFAMALTIGVFAGTYSSFFVAAPLVTIFKEREPQYKKRLATAAAAAGGSTVDGPVASGTATSTGVTSSGATKSNPAKSNSSKGRSGGNSRKRTSR
jgi:preprotein translocase SecF subunit